MIRHRHGWPTFIVCAGVISCLALVACNGSDADPDDLSGSPPSSTQADVNVMDPCGGADHPCTLGEVTPAVRERTHELTVEVISRLSATDATFDGIVKWLRGLDDVAHVSTGAEGLRFRVRGGRGHWMLLRTSGTVATLGAPPALPAMADRGVEAELVQDPTRPATTGRRRKRALLVSPFRWQWQVEDRVEDPGFEGPRYAPDGIDQIAQALRARDYAEVTVMAEAIHPTDPKRTIGGVGLDGFTTWDDYDYVHILTHGGAMCDTAGVCMPSLLAPWTEAYLLQKAEEAYNADQESLVELLGMVGVETATSLFSATTFDLPSNLSGSFRVSAAPRDIPEILRGGKLRTRPTPGPEPGTLVGDFVMLTPAFFHAVYPAGVSDAILVLSACSSGHTSNLAGVLSGTNSVVLGWKETMTVGAAAAAGELLARTLVEVDEVDEDDSGVTVEQSVQRIRDWLDDIGRDPPTRKSCEAPPDRETEARCTIHNYGRVLTVLNEVPADPVTGATLAIFGDSTMRAREVVYLFDDQGSELQDSAVVGLVSADGDATQPAVALRMRVDGLGLEANPGAVKLRLAYGGREIPVPGPLERRVADGVWEVEHRLPMRPGIKPGDRFTVEAIATVPDGGESRWEYRDLEVAACTWSGSVTGIEGGGGPLRAYWGSVRTDEGAWPPIDIDAMVQDGDPQAKPPWLRITLSSAGTVPRRADLDDWREISLAIPGIAPGQSGSFERVWGKLTLGSRSFPGNAEYLRRNVIGLPGGTGIGYLLTTKVSIERYDDDRVIGSFEGRFLDRSRIPRGKEHPVGVGIHPFPDATITVSGKFDILTRQRCTPRSGLRR